MAPKAIISPSLLAADFARLAEEAKRVVDGGADWWGVTDVESPVESPRSSPALLTPLLSSPFLLSTHFSAPRPLLYRLLSSTRLTLNLLLHLSVQHDSLLTKHSADVESPPAP
jgi:hypothetical protein